jgi:hypothetical protein
MNSRIVSIEAKIQRYDRPGQQRILRILRRDEDSRREKNGEAALDLVLSVADILMSLNLDTAKKPDWR